MKKIQGLSLILTCIAALLCMTPQTVSATNSKIKISGQIYTLNGEDTNFDYEGKNSEVSSSNNTYGTLLVSGELEENGKHDGVVSYNATGTDDDSSDTDKSAINFVYQYDSKLLNADDSKEWCLYEDKSKNIGSLSLDEKVGKGAIIVQSSFDGKNWSTDLINTNVFESVPENKSDSLYSTNMNQLVNGCFYKVTVAYQTRKKAGNQKIGPITAWSKYDYKEHVEVYEFYICNEAESALAAKADDKPIYNFNSDPVNTGMDNGYSGTAAVKTDDMQNGWSLGQFYINGFSGNAHYYDGDESKKENPVFLKNVGDRLTLWFRLDQRNLDALNGNEYLSINPDEKGSDQAFHVPAQNFKRGALIVKFTNYENQSRTNVYTDYLPAAATTSADTKVQLFEEGDYEVALDYEIKDNSPLAWKIPKPAKYSAYRISFKFSVRNSNCMVYPMDLKTGAELRVPYTENGFKLDLARSRYLDLSVKKKVLTADGLDLRVSQISSDQEEFTDEGIYEFTVRNEITRDEVTKVIYVGSDNLMKAYVKYGKDYGGSYSIADLKEMQGNGYQFNDDGSIDAPVEDVQEELNNAEAAVTTAPTQSKSNESVNETSTDQIQGAATSQKTDEVSNSTSEISDSNNTEATETEMGITSHLPEVAVVVILVVLIIVALLIRKKSGRSNHKDKGGQTE